MSTNQNVAIIIPAWNEEKKIGRVLDRIPPSLSGGTIVVDDGSTDRTAAVALARGVRLISLPRKRGVGHALRTGISLAREHNFGIAVFLAGNNKDDPAEIPRLVAPVVNGDADLVVGSRYAMGGEYGGDMSLLRKIATRIHPWLLSWAIGKRLTESTNGFRALRLSCLDDSSVRLDQSWLDGYGLEVYLLYKLIKRGFVHVEVPCTKVYPPRKIGNTKIRPIIDWWDILRPIFALSLKLRS